MFRLLFGILLFYHLFSLSSKFIFADPVPKDTSRYLNFEVGQSTAVHALSTARYSTFLVLVFHVESVIQKSSNIELCYQQQTEQN